MTNSHHPYAAANTPAAGPRNPWLLFAVLLMGSFLGPLSGSIINVALPAIASDYSIDLQTVKWVTLIYLLGSAALLPVVGKLGRWVGEGRQYTTGMLVFTVAAAACALAPHSGVSWLVVWRGIQSIGAALMFGMAPALVTRYVPGHRRSLAFGLIGSVVAVALITGPALGVVICDLLNWRWIFGVLLLAGAITAVAAFSLLPKDERDGRPVIPTASILGWFILILGLVLISEAFSKGLWFVFLPLTGSLTAAGIALFAYAETRRHRLFDYALFAYPAFWRGVVSSILLYVTISVMILFMPFYLEDYLQLSTGLRGLFFSLGPIATVFAGPLAGHLADRIGFRIPIISGLVATLLGLATMAWATAHGVLWVFGLGAAITGAGNGMFSGPNFSAMMGSVSPIQRSIASSMSSLTRNIGFLLGTSVGALGFSLLLAVVGGRAMMLAARTEQLALAVPLETFVAAFSNALIVCVGLIVLALGVCLGFPNRVGEHVLQTSAE
ncbi:MFS transporter [bacterium]|nr:MFS transporter [bacterium]